jgi:hypothetical protein
MVVSDLIWMGSRDVDEDGGASRLPAAVDERDFWLDVDSRAGLNWSSGGNKSVRLGQFLSWPPSSATG